MPGLFRTSNAALNDKTFEGQLAAGGDVMTLQGTVNKTGVLLVCVFVASAWTWGLARSESPERAVPWMLGGLIGGTIFAFVTIFKKAWSPYTAPIYAVLEGLALGGISSLIDRALPGVAIHAVGLTFGTLGVLLFAYTSDGEIQGGCCRGNRRNRLGLPCGSRSSSVWKARSADQ